MEKLKSEDPVVAFTYCPRCGHNQVEAINHSIKCSACGLHLFFNAAASVIGLIEDVKGRILLTRRAMDPFKGSLDLPGGFADPGEGIEEALKREISEELNLQVESFNYMGSFSNVYPFSGINIYTTDIVFRCQVSNWEQMQAADDVQEILFFKKDEIPLEKVVLGSIREVLKSYCGAKE